MKTIGIKLADGSFYPVLQENTPSVKTLELTTAHNNQTKVMVDLYRSKECTMEDAEYVDSLQIENLIAHPNGEPSISFSVSLDENNELAAKIEDPETGKESGTSIALVSRTIEERLTTDEYDINDKTLDESELDEDKKEDNSDIKKNVAKAAVGGGLLMAAGALIAKEHGKTDKDEPVIQEDTDVIDEPLTMDDFGSETEINEDELPSEIDIQKEATNEEPVQEPVEDIPVDEISEDDMFQQEIAPIAEDFSSLDDENTEDIPEEIEIEKTEDDPLADFGNFDDIMNDTIADEEKEVPATDDSNDINESTLEDFNLDDITSDDKANGIVSDLPDFDNLDTPEDKNDDISTDSLDDLNLDDLSLSEDDNTITEDESSTDSLDALNLDDLSLPEDEELKNEDSTDSLDDLNFDDLPIPEDDSTVEEASTEDLDDFNLDDFKDTDSAIDDDTTIADDLPDFDDIISNDEDSSLDNNSLDDEFAKANEEIPDSINSEDDTNFDDIVASSDIEDKLSDDPLKDFATDSIDDDDTSFDLPDDLDSTKSGEDIASDDKFFGNNFGGFGDTSNDELPSFDDVDSTVAAEDDDESPLDLSDLGDFEEEPSTEEDNNFDDDFFDSPSFNESNNVSSSGNGGLSFTGLYDKETEMGIPGKQEDDVKKKTKTPVIICVICAIICIIATLLVLFIIPSKYNLINKSETTQQIEKEEEKEVVVEEPKKEEKVEIPEAKEDEIVIVEQAEEVIPEQPELPEVKPEDISYKIIWGDTLWDIADSYYKNPWRYKDIARHNDIKNPDHIISGTRITIPAE